MRTRVKKGGNLGGRASIERPGWVRSSNDGVHLVEVIGFVIVLGGVIAILFTTASGQRLAKRYGIRGLTKGSAPREDREYLLRVCGDDDARVEEMLARARRRNPEMSEAEAYRKAIRSHLRDKM